MKSADILSKRRTGCALTFCILIEVNEMVIYYGCRHCGKELGVLNHTEIDISLRFLKLLEERDMAEMIVSEKDGYFRLEVICEYCQQALDAHPDYHELDHFLQ